MFDLKTSIEKWCMRLKHTGFASEEEVLELRDHLESDIDRLTDTGHTEEEAFLIASEKVGSIDSLSHEFFKLGLMSRLARYPTPLKLITLVLFLVGLLGLVRISAVMLMVAGVIPFPFSETGSFNPPTQINYFAILFRLFLTCLFLYSAIQLLRLKKFGLYAGRFVFALYTFTLMNTFLSETFSLFTSNFSDPASNIQEAVQVTNTYNIMSIGELCYLLVIFSISALCLKSLFSAKTNILFNLSLDFDKA